MFLNDIGGYLKLNIESLITLYFKLYFIMTNLGNLDAMLGGYFESCFIIAKG